MKNQDDTKNGFSLACAMGLPDEVEAHLRDTDSGLCNCQKNILLEESDIQVSVHHCASLDALSAEYDVSTQYVTIPLDSRSQRIGMINMLCSQNYMISENDLDVLGTIGQQITDFIENAWLQASLREKEFARQVLLNALVKAQEDERARLARELHDGAGQQLTGLLVRLKALEKQAPDEEFAEKVGNLCQTTSMTIENVRSLSHRLRPAVLEELGLEAALRTLADEMLMTADLTYECKFSLNGRRLPFEIETSLYRIAQESLTNIINHAEASQVIIELMSLPHVVCLQVEDNGQGFASQALMVKGARHGLGVISMQERAEMLGGSFVIESGLGSGTSVQVRIPMPLEAIV